ncbi:unnamed protein product, partial [Mesorhabditis spiculigera]
MLFEDSEHPNDYEGHYFDPGEAASSTVFFIIGVLSVFVFLRIALYHYRHGFETHFQKIFFVCTANDLVAHYSFMFRVRIPTWGFFEVFWYVREGFFPGLVSWMSEYCIMFQYLGTLLIALNRATALAFPYKYVKIWGPYTWHYIGITALIPLIYRAPSFTATSKFYRLGWGLYIPHTTENGDFAVSVQKGYYPICGVVIVLTLLVNLYTAFKLFTYTKAMHKRELRFHITTLAQFSAQLINTLELILVNTIYLNESYVIFLLQPIFADIANFLPLWVLLLISEETRLMVAGRHQMPSSVSVISVTEYLNIKVVR